MNKPLLVYQAPIFTRSGYGDHARDILKSLFKMDKYDVKIVPTRWGNTPQNQIKPESEFGLMVFPNVITKLDRKPDIFMQMSVANEFEPKGNYNIGITAGVETTIIPKEFIDGSNKMDLIIVPSTFTQNVMLQTAYQEKNNQTGEIVNEHRITKPVEVLFEGVDLERYLPTDSKVDILDGVLETDFNFLYVGHWLKGDIGQDRKDVGMVIKTFATVFKYLPKDKRPGLILKTSHAGFSVIDRENTRQKIDDIINVFGDDLPKIYLLHGDLEDSEMSELYNHPKVNAMVSFTKGEGYGRPLAEFARTGKPVLVSNWSGHVDFINPKYHILLPGKLTPVHKSAQSKGMINEGTSWFTVDYAMAGGIMKEVHKNYKKYAEKSRGSGHYMKTEFGLDKMNDDMKEMIDKALESKPQMATLSLPKLKKVGTETPTLKLPKLKKVTD